MADWILEWDREGERYLENGDRHGVLYTKGSGSKPLSTASDYEKSKYYYGHAEVWNGLTAVTETPAGAEANDVYADDIKYATLRSAETFGGTIESFAYPPTFAKCDGSAEPQGVSGVHFGQQGRDSFGFSFESQVMNDTATSADDDEKLHIWYGCSASPSERSYSTINDSPEGISFSWEITSTPLNVSKTDIPGLEKEAISTITITKSEVANPANYEALKKIMYGYKGGDGTVYEGRLPYPSEVVAIIRNGITGDQANPNSNSKYIPEITAHTPDSTADLDEISDLTAGGTKEITFSDTAGAGELTFSIANSDIAGIDSVEGGKVTVRGKTAGTTTITAKVSETPFTASAEKVVAITVSNS